MSLEYIKGFLRIDTDYDDEYILLLQEAAKEYVIDAVGTCQEEDGRVRLILLNLIASLYENRQYTINKLSEKVLYPLKTMLLQLQLHSEDNHD